MANKAAAQVFACSDCGKSRPAAQFSNTQKKKADGVRKCSGCIASNQAEEAAQQAAAVVGDVVFEGQPAGAPQANRMGAFEPMRPAKMVNRRAVWQAAGGKDRYAFFADDGM